MASLYLDADECARWYNDSGDNTHSIEYNLTPDSTVVEVGGFVGAWAKRMFYKYACNMYIIEPLPIFYGELQNRLGRHKKVRLSNVGVGLEDKKDIMYLGNDGSSFNVKTEQPVEVELRTISRILDEWGLAEVDLLQMNIEGAEYEIIEDMIQTGVIDRIKNIQVQFHLGIEDDVEKHYHISKGLEARGFKVKYSYLFAWEGWTKL